MDTEDDYYGLIVKGKLIADGFVSPDSLLQRPTSHFALRTSHSGPGIRFAPARFSGQGNLEIVEEPGSWKGVGFEPSTDLCSVVRGVRIE